MDTAPPKLADDGLEITAPPAKARPEAVIVAQLAAGGVLASKGASACVLADAVMKQAIVAAGAIPLLVELLTPGYYSYAAAGLVSLPWSHVQHTPAIVADMIKRLLQAPSFLKAAPTYGPRRARSSTSLVNGSLVNAAARASSACAGTRAALHGSWT
jgi:hypothetical protein